MPSRRFKRFVGLSGLLVLVVAAGFLVPTLWFKPWSIDHYYARTFLSFMLRHPMALTSMGFLDNTPIRYFADDLDDFSIAAETDEEHFLDTQLAVLRSYDRKHMNHSQALSADVMEWFMENQVEGKRFRWHSYPVNQLSGIQSGLPEFMMNLQPMKTPRDAEDYVKRVSKFGVAFDQVIEQLDARDQKGIIPPRFVLEKVIAQLNGLIGPPPRENALYTTFAAKLDTLPKLDAAKKQQLEAALAGQIEGTVYPAYRRLIATLEREHAKATDDDGVWKLPDGAAYYAWCLRNHTTTDIPADSIHALGLAEVKRIQAEMWRLLSAKGYGAPTLAAAMQEMSAEPRFHYPDGDSGRAMILADFQAIIDDAGRRSQALFGVQPKHGVEVRRVPPFREKTAPGGYYQPPSIGGARPGVFYANLRDPGEIDKPGMRTLAYHEAIPGHHFQNTVAQELKDLPFFRRVIPFTAYGEGWGLYAERLALEQGFHPTAYDSLGAYQAELFRAVRLVVDTGIHQKHWTRQQAIDWMVANTGMGVNEVTTEIERYIVNPGQACAYKVGQLKLLELRQRAIDRLGPRFDIRKFHDVVLTNGELPLGLLDRVIDEWIATEQRGAEAAGKS